MQLKEISCSWEKFLAVVKNFLQFANIKNFLFPPKGYYFDCDCEKCKDESVRAKMTSMACPKADCDSFIALDDEKCTKCRTEIEEENRRNFDEISDMTKAMLEEMGNAETRYIDICRNLVKKQRGVLHEVGLEKFLVKIQISKIR